MVREYIRRIMISIEEIDELYYRMVRTMGIKETVFVLFYAIADEKVYSQKQLCEEWHIPRTTLNTVVMECVKKGYIELIPNGHKEKNIILTKSGEDYARKLLNPIFEAEKRAVQQIEGIRLAQELEQFSQCLKKEFEEIGNEESK